jgi:hypothetical protein
VPSPSDFDANRLSLAASRFAASWKSDARDIRRSFRNGTHQAGSHVPLLRWEMFKRIRSPESATGNRELFVILDFASPYPPPLSSLA